MTKEYAIHDVLVQARHELLTKGWGQDAEVLLWDDPDPNLTSEQEKKLSNTGTLKLPWATFAASNKVGLCAIGSVYAVICKNVVLGEYGEHMFKHVKAQVPFEERVLKYLLNVVHDIHPPHSYETWKTYGGTRETITEPWDSIPEWNDHPERTFKEVLDVFECAIDRAKKEKK